MATAAGGTPTVARQSAAIASDGSATITLVYTNASGVIVHSRIVRVPADGSSVTDQWGNVLASPAPAALVTAISSFTSQLDTMVANAATAGKLAL
jgi:hypothetical protein